MYKITIKKNTGSPPSFLSRPTFVHKLYTNQNQISKINLNSRLFLPYSLYACIYLVMIYPYLKWHCFNSKKTNKELLNLNGKKIFWLLLDYIFNRIKTFSHVILHFSSSLNYKSRLSRLSLVLNWKQIYHGFLNKLKPHTFVSRFWDV